MTPMTLPEVLAFMRRLGNFWSTLFDAKSQIVSWSRAQAWHRAQLYLDLLEAIQCRVFKDVPVFHRELWLPILVSSSDLYGAVARYGDGFEYGNQLIYGGVLDNAWETPVDGDVKRIRFLMNNPVTPTAVYTEGIHYRIVADRIVWSIDPLLDPDNADSIKEVGDDKQLMLWGHEAETDKQFVFHHLGSLVQLSLDSSEAYKEVALQLATLYTEFPSVSEFVMLVCAMAGVPAARDYETVEEVIVTPRVQVVTDKRVYDIPEGSVVTVKVGDRLQRGDVLTEDVSVVELAYRMPNESELPALSLGVNLLSGDFAGELVLMNQQQLVTTAPNGMARFPVTGSSADVDKFWASIDAGGGLPLTPGEYVNPARVVLECMGANALVVKISTSTLAISPSAISVFLRNALSPRLILITYVSYEITDDRLNMVEPDEDLEIIDIYEVTDEVKPVIADVTGGHEVKDC